MKKLFCIVLILVLSHNYMQGMEKSYCLRQPLSSAENPDNTLQYGECPVARKRVSPELYQQFIENFPVFCVDIILINPNTYEYLTLLRRDKPAQEVFYPIGSRLLKGETYFDAAKRICYQEVHALAQPLGILCTLNHIYPDSAWGCPSQTPEVLIIALCQNIDAITVDHHHKAYKWCSLFEEHPIEFTEIGRRLALQYLQEHNLIKL